MELYKVEKKKDDFSLETVIEVSLLFNESTHLENIAYFSVKRLFKINVLTMTVHDFMSGMHYYYSPKSPISEEEFDEKIEQIKTEMEIGIKRGMEFLDNMEEKINYEDYIAGMQGAIYYDKV